MVSQSLRAPCLYCSPRFSGSWELTLQFASLPRRNPQLQESPGNDASFFAVLASISGGFEDISETVSPMLAMLSEIMVPRREAVYSGNKLTGAVTGGTPLLNV